MLDAVKDLEVEAAKARQHLELVESLVANAKHLENKVDALVDFNEYVRQNEKIDSLDTGFKALCFNAPAPAEDPPPPPLTVRRFGPPYDIDGDIIECWAPGGCTSIHKNIRDNEYPVWDDPQWPIGSYRNPHFMMCSRGKTHSPQKGDWSQTGVSSLGVDVEHTIYQGDYVQYFQIIFKSLRILGVPKCRAKGEVRTPPLP